MKTQLTTEESAKLIELGVSPERASESKSSVAYGNGARGIMKVPETPIFTLTDIIDILPKTLDVKGESARLQVYNHPAGYWVVSYATCDGGTLTYQNPCSAEKELIDALYSLLVWCLEKGYVKQN
ncbi:hypothetical protein [Muribaculum intestinale]|uniref:hypothetical protein n=1 Tax=Muribaculum intestinale TaxID=1796646 RepID=UPI0025A95965|nr:hypothetical protein [Muribaculum intestinale]